MRLYERFDVRAKLVFTLLMTILPFTISTPGRLWLLTALVFLFSLTQDGLRKTFGSLALIASMLFFMVLFMPLSSRGGEALIMLGDFMLVSKEGFINFLMTSGRFVSISLSCSLMLHTTTRQEMLLALEWFHLPPSAAMVVTLALCFIPELSRTFTQVRESQRLRLPDPDDEDARRRPFKSVFPTLVSVMVMALRSIPQTAAAIDLRGYGRTGSKTHYKKLSFSGWTLFTHFAIGIIMAAILFTLGSI